MPYEIQQTRWDRLIRRVSGSIGPGSRVGVSISDLFPVLDVESVPAELLLLSGTALCHGAAQATGAVGELPNVILFNPEGSGHLITITLLAVRSSTSQQVRAAVSSEESGAQVLTERFRDARLITPTTLPVGQIRTLSNASQIAQQVDFRVGTNLPLIFGDADRNSIAVLSPNTKYVIAGTGTATSITVTYWWRERPAEESELNL